MKEITKCEGLKHQVKAYERIFDTVRVVDPVTKKATIYKDGKDIYDNMACYSSWLDGNECKDCIIIKALNHKKTFVKIQNNADKMFLMSAVPLELNGDIFALELIKDITDNLVFETVYQCEGHELRNIVQDLNTLIMKDTLTSLYNRRYIDRTLPEEIARCNDKNPLSIAMIDVDHFKSINDTYGHNAGDIIIKKLGQILSNSIRNDTDWAARYGGDEFLICLPNTDNKKAYKVLERIRKNVEKINIKIENIKIKVTVSGGLYTLNNNILAPVDLIKYADDKLYNAKEQGRNRIAS
ncbi:GGDEF domain-containing protein [Clostridium thermopalmarium]|uniref:GGDEF domain-containing protein n=1 Tax=Clostridium thermopalmarium TaxID=29373 RepID=UPI0023579886|nr:GGDEF domain-containing protein [Clostridium thermopalmarium]